MSAKLGVLLRDYLRNLRQGPEQARRSVRRVTPAQFIGGIERFPVLERLVALQLEERFGIEIIDPLRVAPEESARILSDALRGLEAPIVAGVRRAPTTVHLTYLVGFVVDAYQKATGHFPGQAWDEFPQLETGTGLEICRLLDRELNAPENQLVHMTELQKPVSKALPCSEQETGVFCH